MATIAEIITKKVQYRYTCEVCGHETLLIFKNANYDDTHELIKKAVYKPQKDAKKDMFNIRVHGLLIQK